MDDIRFFILIVLITVTGMVAAYSADQRHEETIDLVSSHQTEGAVQCR